MAVPELITQAPSQHYLITAFSCIILALSITIPILSGLVLRDLDRQLYPGLRVFIKTSAFPCEGPSCPKAQDHCGTGDGAGLEGTPGERLCWADVDGEVVRGVSVALIVAAVIGICMAVGGIWGWRVVRKRTAATVSKTNLTEGGDRGVDANIRSASRISLALFLLSMLHFLLQLTFLIYIFLTEYTPSNRNFSFTPYFNDNTVLRGPYTAEGWVCSFNKYSEDMGKTTQKGELLWMERGCLMAKTARWGMVPMLVCAGIVMGAAGWRWGRIRMWSVATRGEGRELGFMPART